MLEILVEKNRNGSSSGRRESFLKYELKIIILEE